MASTELNSSGDTEPDTSSETEKNTSNDTTKDPGLSFTKLTDLTWVQIVQNSENFDGVQEIEQDFNSETADLAKWFKDYNKETLQRIPSSNPDMEQCSPNTRAEIIFYNTKEKDIQVIVKKMIDAMLLPLMEENSQRPYTITKYELAEQPLIQINENVWLLVSISGYYSFEGIDLVTMEEALEYEEDVKDGMIPFIAQGSSGVHQYLLIKDGTVYRLQRAGNMGYFVEW